MPSCIIEISYGQICVFNSSLENPFNDWTDAHIEKGLSWRAGSVSFLVSEPGSHEVEFVTQPGNGEIGDRLTKRLEVPFDVFDEAGIEYGGISDLRLVLVPKGKYWLRFEEIGASPGAAIGGIRLTLLPRYSEGTESYTLASKVRALLMPEAKPAV